MTDLIQQIEAFAAIDWPNDVISRQRHFSQMEARRDQIVAAIRDQFSHSAMIAAVSLFTQAATNDLDYAVGGRVDDDEAP